MAAEVPVLGTLQGQVWDLEPLRMHWQPGETGHVGGPQVAGVAMPRRPEGKQGTTEHTRRVLLHQNTKSVEGGPCKNEGDQGGWALGRHAPGAGVPLGRSRALHACFLPAGWV